jgi:uncharacterized RDD family membrane protein YckC
MTAERQLALEIETPEGVVFRYELATPAARAAAWAVDAAAIAALSYAAGKVAKSLGAVSEDWAGALSALLFFVIQMGYGMVLEWRWRGQTLGKRLVGLRVIDARGMRLQVSQIAIRNVLRLVDSLPYFYLVGGIAAFVSRKNQRLGDLAANTVVARERHWQEPDIAQLAPAKYNSLLQYPHLAVRLRAHATPAAVALAADALTRRDRLDPAARAKLFDELADYFRSLVAFPEEVSESLTSEQYVRSVMQVVFGARSRQ